MNISQLIVELEKIKSEHGDLNVCIGEYDDYWGTTYEIMHPGNLQIDHHAQPEGPKSGKSETALTIIN